MLPVGCPEERTLNRHTGSTDLAKLRALIADDAFAATFQTMGRYRTALLQVASALAHSSASNVEPVVTDHSVDANKMVALGAHDLNALALERELVRRVAELPDRTSPEDDPMTMLAKAEELGACLHGALENLGFRITSDTAQSGQRAGVVERQEPETDEFTLRELEETARMCSNFFSKRLLFLVRRVRELERWQEVVRENTPRRDLIVQADADGRRSNAARDVMLERLRQDSEEGWTPKHDDEHTGGEMGEAAICYIQGKTEWGYGNPHQRWPWALAWWKQKDRRRNLVKAGALILAEIERLDRAAALAKQEGGKGGAA